MAQRIGLVTAISGADTAEVMTDRKGACGGCSQSDGCRSCLSGAKIVSSVQNPIGAQPGDVVAIDITRRGLWIGALLFYIWPVLCLLAGAGIGDGLLRARYAENTGMPIIFGFIGLGIGIGITFLISRSRFGNSVLRPRITRIVDHSGAMNSGEKRD